MYAFVETYNAVENNAKLSAEPTSLLGPNSKIARSISSRQLVRATCSGLNVLVPPLNGQHSAAY